MQRKRDTWFIMWLIMTVYVIVFLILLSGSTDDCKTAQMRRDYIFAREEFDPSFKYAGRDGIVAFAAKCDRIAEGLE